MQDILLRKLIDKSFFKEGTEVDAKYRGVGLDGLPFHTFGQTFTVTGIFETRKTKQLRMDCFSTVDGRTVRIGVDNITKIDGMDPERFAENYMIDPTGEEIKVVGMRRGRRPKNWVDPNGIDDDDDDFDGEEEI